jgi:uncharacterized protein (TIGR02246 family)
MTVTEPETAAREADIRRLVERANALQNDREPFVALHAENAIVVNIAGRRVVGRDALDRAMAAALDSRLARVVTRTEVEEIAFLRPDVALVACAKHVEDRNDDADAGTLPTTARLTYVVVDDGDGWRIALAQTTPVASA